MIFMLVVILYLGFVEEHWVRIKSDRNKSYAVVVSEQLHDWEHQPSNVGTYES